MSYRIDHDNLTIIHTDEAGEQHDLNAEGEPCATADDLRDLVYALRDAGAYDNSVCEALLLDA